MFHIGASFVSLAPIFYKSQSALILLLLLSKSQPLALGGRVKIFSHFSLQALA